MQNPPLPDPSETNEADSAEPSDREVVIAYTSKHFTERVVYTSCVQLKNNVLLLFTRTSVSIPGEFSKKARVISALLTASTLPFLSLSFLCLSLNLFVLARYREIQIFRGHYTGKNPIPEFVEDDFTVSLQLIAGEDPIPEYF